jgi:hypothetical protein
VRLIALALHGITLIALVGWSVGLAGPTRYVALVLVLVTGLPIALALATRARAALQRSALLLVLYVGLTTLEVVASQRENQAAIVVLYASLATLGLVLVMLRHRRSTPRESPE